jgi:hypothetical protein
MKKLIIALCSVLSLNAFAKENITNYIYNVQIVDTSSTEKKSPHVFKFVGIINQPISAANETEYSYDNKCVNKQKIKSKLDKSTTTLEYYAPKLKSGVSMMIYPESETNGKMKLDTLIQLSNISSVGHYENNGCMVPLYDITRTDLRNIYELNLGQEYKFNVGKSYNMIIKVDKKED